MFEARCYNVMIISTGNLREERGIIRDTIYHWNEIHSEYEGIIFKASGYDIDMCADSGDRPQALINESIVKRSDFAIAVFWNRLGTQTGAFQSGSAEEIYLHLKNDRKVLTYFSKIKVDIDDIDTTQLEKLKQYKKELAEKVSYKEFDSYDKLKMLITDDLTSIAHEFEKKSATVEPSAEERVVSVMREPDINYELQKSFLSGTVLEINKAYEYQIPRFRTKLNQSTKEIIINDIWSKLKSAAGDFLKIVTPMKLLSEYFDFIQNDQLSILGLVLDELTSICFSQYYSYEAEPYTKDVFNKITKEQYKIIRKMYMSKMLIKYQYIYELNPILEKFLKFTSISEENNSDENEIRELILKQHELWEKRPFNDETEKIFSGNIKKLENIKKRLDTGIIL